MTTEQLTLPEMITVHCFLLTCGHVEQGTDPDVVHDAMEGHYGSRHRALIGRLAVDG